MDITKEFLTKTLEYLNSAEAFLEKNVPAYVEELLTFEVYSSVFHIVLWVGLTLTFGLMSFFFYRKYKREGIKKWSDLHEMTGAATILISIIALIVVSCNVHTIIKVKTAPRVFLVEKISRMVK